MRTPTTYTLYELNNLVRQSVEDALPDTYWVTGELLQGGVGGGGHFYGELVEKDEVDGRIVAKARLNIWAGQFVRLRARFEMETGQTLRAGLRLQLLVRVTFHEQFGYSLVAVDIDATYTLGDLARRRREILRKLEEEGVLHDNQTLTLPRLLTRVAVISSATAAGYGDFCDQLLHNDHHLRFEVKLFPALMQGEYTVGSVLQAMERVVGEAEAWDVLVIIRGGGATSDLADFESYDLAAAVAQFPIPVIVGIGHDRDETVLDYVAHTRVKTPTAAAALLVDHQHQELLTLDDLEQRLRQAVGQRLQTEKQRLSRIAIYLPLSFARMKERIEHRLEMLLQRMVQMAQQRVEREKARQQLIGQRMELLDPRRLLKLGYSITTCGGRLVRNADELKPGDELVTQLEQGTINSIVQ